jgi:hypothetical protein
MRLFVIPSIVLVAYSSVNAAPRNSDYVPQHLKAAPAAAARARVLPTGAFVATRLNYHPLPRIERVPSQDGWEHWFRLMDGNVKLKPDGHFIASFKYYRQHVRPRAAVRPGPLLNESYKGKFTVRGTQITFVPDPIKSQKGRIQPIVGTIVNDQLSIPYIVAEGQSKHPLRLDMKRDASIW